MKLSGVQPGVFQGRGGCLNKSSSIILFAVHETKIPQGKIFGAFSTTEIFAIGTFRPPTPYPPPIEPLAISA